MVSVLPSSVIDHGFNTWSYGVMLSVIDHGFKTWSCGVMLSVLPSSVQDLVVWCNGKCAPFVCDRSWVQDLVVWCNG